MEDYKSLSHTKWQCKHHVIFIPKYRKRALYGVVRKHLHFLKRERNYAGQRIWARGYFVDTVGRDTETIRRYIAEQEKEDRRIDQLEMAELTKE